MQKTTKGEDYKCLCTDSYKKRDQGRYCIGNESKNTYRECTPETKAFSFTKMLYSIKNREDF